MANEQLNLFNKGETRLDQLLNWSFNVFDRLLQDYKDAVEKAALCPDPWENEKDWLKWFKAKFPVGYQLAFSGGKDSHVLLGVYLEWTRSRNTNLPIKVVFSDTFLESPQLYELVDAAARLCDRIGIPFVKVQPSVNQSFWVKLVGLGYPVPNYRNRWCTKDLKIVPMKKVPGGVIAGSHAGESTKRDTRLDGCGSSECGIDQINNKAEPLAPWTNCAVWDWIILFSDQALYLGVSENLMNLYDIAESTSGSLRMGCGFCTAVKEEQIEKQVNDGIVPAIAIKVRRLIEKHLRLAPRILSERTQKAGAILVDARIEFWKELQPDIPELRKYGWIDDDVEQMVNQLLRDRAYPPTYRQEWIKEQEPLAVAWNPPKKKKSSLSSEYDQLAIF